MKPAEYITLAQKTSADVSPEILERLCDPQIISTLIHYTSRLSAIVLMLDNIKKHVFYGKPISLPKDNLKQHNHEEITRLMCNGPMVKLFHGILGKTTEAGELMEGFFHALALAKKPDEVNIIEEMGDDQWYNAEILSALNTSFEEIWNLNIAKLKARYGSAFSEEAALGRDLVNERKVLEGGACEHGVALHEACPTCEATKVMGSFGDVG